ncbi:MAG: hypothetical protein LZF86_100194 [Nitrospira sp.]|nr:MAG: hypothetical protein LZF86_100194 [Nitrospira sp.]
MTESRMIRLLLQFIADGTTQEQELRGYRRYA